MKRTNLVLDEQLLERATRVLGHKTYSGAVNQALEDAIRLHKIRGIAEFVGSGLWEGNLSSMREDQRERKNTRKRRR
jgi:Arc/MetJ family transcription regulator